MGFKSKDITYFYKKMICFATSPFLARIYNEQLLKLTILYFADHRYHRKMQTQRSQSTAAAVQ
jgi:hypothetical protein